MTTYTPFVPNPQVAFSFQPVLDGATYNVTVTWNVFGQDYYVNIYDLNGNLIVNLPMVGSPPGVNISSLTWANGIVTAQTAMPVGWVNTYATMNLTLTGNTPDAYNGVFQSFITGPSMFTFPLASDPGLATTFGAVYYNISLTAGYFDSTLVFRTQSQNFEVSP